MQKINNAAKKAKPLPRIARIAAIIAVILVMSMAVYAMRGWTGFLSTDEMSQREILKIMEMIDTSGWSQSADPDGTIHLFDSVGNETKVLSPEEAELFEEALKENRTKLLLEGAGDLLDIDSLDLYPTSITPVATEADGSFGDFLLSNGSMVILHENEQNGYLLQKGDIVTVTFDASNRCIMEFGIVLDGRMQETVSEKNQSHAYTYEISEDGLYCFTLGYYSSDADNITNGKIQIDRYE